MMKLIQSLLHDEILPTNPRTGPASHAVGCLRTVSEMGASGASPWNTSRRGPTVDNFTTAENLLLPKK